MKKINNLVLLLLIMMNFSSCQKDDISGLVMDNTFNEKHDISINVTDGMLFFKTITDYENTIDYLSKLDNKDYVEWEENISFFNSMRRQLKEDERDDLGIEDDLFASLINSDGMIHIGDNIFQVDVINEVVLATKASNYKTGSGHSLNVFNTNNEIRTFSIDDDILSIIEEKKVDNVERSSYCGSKKKGYYHIYTHYGYDVKYKIAYQKAGIYHSLIAKIKREYYASGVEIGLHTIATTGFNFWKNKKHKQKFSRDWKIGYSREYSWRPYSSTRRLKGYRYHVEFYINDDIGGEYWMPKLEINCGSY